MRGDLAPGVVLRAGKRLVEAIDGGETLRLGSLWGRGEGLTPYKAIFIWEDEGDAREIHANQQEVPSFVFMASRPRQPNSSTVGTNDIDHHVSLRSDSPTSTSSIAFRDCMLGAGFLACAFSTAVQGTK